MHDDLSNDARVRQFWNSYASAARPSSVGYRVFSFGDSAELADELSALVIAGTKRATASLARDYGKSYDDVPRAGGFGIVIDGGNKPRCIVRTVQVQIKPMREVDERFAWDEGEGDRSLAWWLSAHRRYFKRQAAREGFVVDDTSEVVLERFEVVWPPEFADRGCE